MRETTSVPLENSPAVSVVICTRDRKRELERCLAGVNRQNYANFDVLVVNNDPADVTAGEIADRHGVAYLLAPEPGLSRARNLGTRASTGDLLVFLDDDAVPDPNWIRNIVVEFKDPQVAAVTGRIQELRFPRTPPSPSNQFFSLDSLGDRRRIVDHNNPDWFEIANFGGIGQGSNMAFRRSALDLCCGFDHRLGRGAPISGSEEHYAFFRLIENGYRIVYTPDALVRHPYPQNLQALRHRELRHLADSTAYLTFLYFEAHGHRRRVIRYVSGALRGVRRHWRVPNSCHLPTGQVSRWKRVAAMLTGPFAYLKTLGEAAPIGPSQTMQPAIRTKVALSMRGPL